MDIDQAIQKANQDLKTKKKKLAIKRRGQSLYLRGILPPKPGVNKGLHQQEIALGLKATDKNIDIAVDEATTAWTLLKSDRFDWSIYTTKSKRSDQKEKISSLTERFAESYLETGLANGRRPFAVKKTLDKDYLSVFKKLPQDEDLTFELAKNLVLSAKPDGRWRKRYKNALKMLSRFANKEFYFSQIVSSYSSKNTVARQLPTDKEIEFYYNEITNKNMEWAYYLGLLAIFGLRPQEAFYSNLEITEDQPLIEVLHNKNNCHRLVFPYPKKWLNDFNIWQPNLPKIKIPDY